MRGGGTALKFVSLFFRLVEFGCAAVILGLFSFFLADLSKNNRAIPTYEKAVEGISGAGVIYTAFAFVLVCCLGGIAIFSFLAIILDFAFCGAFIYIAWATRNGVRHSTGRICTPLGCGNSTANAPSSTIKFSTAHRMETAVFAVAVIGAVLFFLNIFIEFGLMRHHKKEKAFGPGPNNGYTAGSPKRKFWQRKQRNRDLELAGGLGAAKVHPDALPAHAHPADVRTSYATDATAVEPTNKYSHAAPVGQPGYVTPAAHNAPYGRQTVGYTEGTTAMPAGNYHATSNSNGTF